MKPNDVFQIIRWVDASLEMLKAYEGSLKGPEVRIRSLLAVVRNELSRDVLENTTEEPADLPTETGTAVDLVEPKWGNE
jgi:hypothetical protein